MPASYVPCRGLLNFCNEKAALAQGYHLSNWACTKNRRSTTTFFQKNVCGRSINDCVHLPRSPGKTLYFSRCLVFREWLLRHILKASPVCYQRKIESHQTMLKWH